MQKLIMPFGRQMMLCGYKNVEYTKHWGYPHYGVDISSIQGGAGADSNIYASGNGTVLACGFDNSGGNVIVVLYKDCYNHSTGKSCDLIARYMHLTTIAVAVHELVSVGQLLGAEGNTKTGDFHLHLEFDTDVNYPLHSPQVSGKDDHLTAAQGNILRKGIDSTMNPSHILHIGEGQVIVSPTYNPAWLNQEDFNIPKLDCTLDEVISMREYIALQNKLQKVQSECQVLAEAVQRFIQEVF